MHPWRWAVSAILTAGLFIAQHASAATITWTGSAGTNSWHTAANWDLNRVPAAGDDVVIPDMTPDVNVTYSSGSTTINRLTSAEAVTLTNGAATVLTITAASTLNGPFNFNGGLAGAGDVTVNGPMSWTGFGTMSGTGRTIISASGSLTISDSNAKTLGRILENHSTNAVWTNGSMQMNNGMLNNAADGILTINLPANFGFSGFGGTNSVNNAGTMNLSSAGILSANSNVAFNNSGTVNIDAGGLSLNGGGVNTGVFDADAGTTLTFTSSYTHGATSSLSGAGTLTFGAGTHNLSGVVHTNRTINIVSGAFVNFNAPYTFPAIVNLNGTLGGSGDVTMSGTLNWANFATMNGSGKTIVASSATFTISGNGALNLNRRLENHSPNVNWTGSNIQMNGGTLVNEADGVITVSHGADNAIVPSGGSNSISNAGILNKTGPGTMTVFNGIPFTNTGTLNVQAGTMDLAGGLTNFAGTVLTGGTYNVDGTLRFPNANIVTNSAVIILDGPASAIQNPSGANGVANLATNTAGAVFQLKNGRNFVRSGSFDNAGQLMIGPGDNTFSVDTITNSGTLTKPGTGTGNVTTANSLTNHGTIDIPSGTLIVSALSNQSGTTLSGGTYTVGGRLQYANANIATNDASIVLNGPASAIQNLSEDNALGNIVANTSAGSLEIKNGRNLALPATFVNQGQVRIGNDSTLSDNGNYVQSAGATTLDNGTLDPADLADIRSGELVGIGVIAGSVRNSGTCRPSDISITGDYQQMSQGALVEIISGTTAGTEYGRVSVGGTALLAGALNITLSNFIPSVGNTFDFLTANVVEVKLSTINSPVLPNLRGWRFADEPGALQLTVIDCGPSDTDNDGVGDACETAPDLSWHKIAGGGGTSSGGKFKLSSTIGQHDAGSSDAPLAGGEFTLVGGFWPGAEIPQEPACTLVGDMNADGQRNGSDVSVFVICIISGGSDCSCADVDDNGTADVSDISLFVQLLIN